MRATTHRVTRALVALILGAAVSTMAATPTRAAGTGAVLRLVSQTAWVAPGGTFELRVTPPAMPVGSKVIVRLYLPVTTRAAID
ncbi:MAG: hypothetical protein ACXWCB_18810, partial [Acidimicrobiales bacterium]